MKNLQQLFVHLSILLVPLVKLQISLSLVLTIRKHQHQRICGKYIVQCIKNYSGSNLCIIFLLIHALFIPCLRAGRVGVFSNFEIEMWQYITPVQSLAPDSEVIRASDYKFRGTRFKFQICPHWSITIFPIPYYNFIIL